MMRIIATTFIFFCLNSLLWAQKEVPLSANALLEQSFQQSAKAYVQAQQNEAQAALEKNINCDEEPIGSLVVYAGESQEIRFFINTNEIDGEGSFVCTNCDDLDFGTASILLNEEGEQRDSIIYTANTNVGAGLDTVRLQYCAADTCTSIQEYVFLSRRQNRDFYPATLNLNQDEVVELAVNNELPGELKCNFFSDCPDDYEGRDQLAYFTNYNMPIDSIVYDASRVPGLDTVCVTLCDEFGVCDVTHFSFNISANTIAYPIYDDFYQSGFDTDQSIWLDSEVFVNRQMALNPPSVGVATFDGVDFRGRAYDTGYGPADRLTSAPINIPNSANTPTLSFWTQAGGLAFKPVFRDSFLVQFRNQDDDWVTVLKVDGLSINSPNEEEFSFHQVALDAEYQYNGFQFRFLAYNDGTGIRGNWHLDYVRLDDNPGQDAIFNDIAFTHEPDYLLKTYTSIPWRHVNKDSLSVMLASTIDVGLFNHFASGQNLSPSSVFVEEENTGLQPFGIMPTLFNGVEINVDNGSALNRTYDLMGDATGFVNVWSDYLNNMSTASLDDEEELRFDMVYSFENTSQAGLNFVTNNDEVSKTTVFADYFAYDDGSAESAILAGLGEQLAVKYTAEVEDTLRGVQINFSSIGADDIENQQFRLKVWVGELDDSPEFSQIYTPVFAQDYLDTLQAFTSYQLVDFAGDALTIPLPAGDFYIGWEQLSSCTQGNCISIGYDKNRPQGRDFIYSNVGGGWNPLVGVSRGALMLRAVVGSGEPLGPTSVENVENISNKQSLKVYPNPASTWVNIEKDQDFDASQILLFNATGQLVLQAQYRSQLDVSHLSNGLYYMQLINAEQQKSLHKRILIVK